MGWEVRLTESSAKAMTYAVRTRICHFRSAPEILAKFEPLDELLEALYPVVGEEVIEVPYSLLNELLDVMILALHTMPKRSYRAPPGTGNQRGRLNAQKIALVKHLASDAVTRLSVVAP